MDEFFKRMGHFMNDYEIMAIIRRIDVEGDAQIGFSEFAEFMRTEQPVSLSKSMPVTVPYYLRTPLLPKPYEIYRPYEVPVRTFPTRTRSTSFAVYERPSNARVVDDNINLLYTASPYIRPTSLERSRSYYSPVYSRYY